MTAPTFVPPAEFIRDGKVIMGKKIAHGILSELKARVEKLGTTPVIADVLIGEDMASRVYVRMKEKAANVVGIELRRIEFGPHATREELLSKLNELAKDQKIHGIIIERPLPTHLDYGKLLAAVPFSKDVEGLRLENLGALLLNREKLPAATAQGVVLLCEYLGLPLVGKNVTIINHSPTVGRPLAEMFLNRNATVSVCHVFTKNLENFTLKSDIIVTGVGIPGFLKEDMVPEGCIVIDVGFNRNAQGKPCGDANFEGLLEKVSYITPVPGGVGPMTVASLMRNCVASLEQEIEDKSQNPVDVS